MKTYYIRYTRVCMLNTMYIWVWVWVLLGGLGGCVCVCVTIEKPSELSYILSIIRCESINNNNDDNDNALSCFQWSIRGNHSDVGHYKHERLDAEMSVLQDNAERIVAVYSQGT